METAILLRAYRLMCTARAMAETYELNRQVCKYVHSTSRGHEAIQLAAAFHLLSSDYASPYYRDDCMLLAMGYQPFELMLQLLAKAGDPFSSGRSYYAHPNNRQQDKPQMIHQSSATGMQAIPSTGIAQGIQFLEAIGSTRLTPGPAGERPLVLCSLGDGSMTEGEVSEALQFAALKRLPIIYLVQDNGWGISATAPESRSMDAYQYAAGFTGLQRMQVDGSDFEASFLAMEKVVAAVRNNQGPFLVQARVPLLGHHTSGVRTEFYRSREELARAAEQDPAPRLRNRLLEAGIGEAQLLELEAEINRKVTADFEKARLAPDPNPATAVEFVVVPTPITQESGIRKPAGAEKIQMVDAALYAIREIMEDHPEALLYGQDVGRRLGGVFREAATLGQQFGDTRVFNTAIQEAYIIGSTAGLSAVGALPIVEIQFADYVYPGINQLVTEISKSCYLSAGRFPVRTLIRIPVGAYGGGGPYHSGSIESTLLTIKGLKIVYPSNAADMKGLMKAAFYDPNPVVMLEHKGLYWGKVPGTEDAKAVEPSRDYIIPLGKGRIHLAAEPSRVKRGESCCIITYGRGIFWAQSAEKHFPGQVEIIDLRTLWPLDEQLIFQTVKSHGKCLVLTEEPKENSFAEALSGRIASNCFSFLDAPIAVTGAMSTPALPLNNSLEAALLPSVDKVVQQIKQLLNY